MKRITKGFTLVEVIISITLLAIIGITIGLSLNKVNKNRNNNESELTISKIKSAADVYLSSNPTEQNKLYSSKSYLLIKIGDLTNSGLLDKNIIDPTTSEKISTNSKVMASLDENGTIIFDYPLDQSKTEYLQLLNVYLEKGEKASCNIGAKSSSLTYVNNDGTYDMSYNKYACDLSNLKNEVGTYKVNYTYTLSDGVTKSATRKFIVQNEIEVSLTAKMANGDSVISDTWSKEIFTLTPTTNRKANITYTWNDSSNVTKDILYVNNSQIKSYTLTYNVYGINSTVQDSSTLLYKGTTKTFIAKLELPSDVASITPVVSQDKTWHINVPQVTISGDTSKAISGIKKYKYCATTSGTCKPNIETTNNTFNSNILGANSIYVNFVTNAGNTSSNALGYAYYDNEPPVCNTNSGEISSLNSSCTDNGSGINTTVYGYNSTSSGQEPTNSNITYLMSSGCGSTNYYFVQATDNAGNKGDYTYIGYNSVPNCTYASEPSYSGGTTETCDTACSIVNTGQWWGENCANCTQQEFNDKVAASGGSIDVGGGRTVSSYDDLVALRNEGGYSSANNGSCTVGVTCDTYLSDGTISSVNPDSSGTSTPSSPVDDLDQVNQDLDQTNQDLEQINTDIGNIDLSGLDDISTDPIVVEPVDIPDMSDVCLVKGTKILLNNGNYKNIEDINYTDLLSTWNYNTGNLTGNYAGWIEKEHQASSYRHSEYSDGSYLNTIGYHGVFDCDKNEYITVDNPNDYKVGTRILKVDGNKKYCVTVTTNKIINKPVSYYHIESVRYLNVIANDFLTTDGNVMLSNVYSFTKDLKWGNDITILENNKRNLFTLEEINKYNYYPKYLFLAMGSANTKYLTAFADISNDYTELITLLRLQHVLTSESYVLPVTKNDKGINMWKVTTSDNYETSNTLYEEGSSYTLPEPINKKNFVGWYLTGENKIYQPSEKATVNFATFFMAIYKESK